MKNLEFRNVLALLIVIYCLTFLTTLLFVTIPPENKDLVNILSGTAYTALGIVIGWYFGSSKQTKSLPLSAGTVENPINVDATIVEKKALSYSFGDIKITPEEYDALAEEDKKNYSPNFE